ncbi:MAG TPA: hypothetical protein VH187_18685 [Scandinavium sp.]|jgi:hypothetical protein|uniref:hypothetical protein n=1 Tax=Scandinavium sp. TaxID=2830653 RepID=UPI002E359E01|nr:hypothetical protein [Scandinavium sp.]HEX4503165.1 hypothetical protein [Scandinavium sp.]
MPALPFQNLSLGVSPETLNQFWEQFQFSSVPNGQAMMGIASDSAAIVTLTSAQLLALQTTAVQLVAPPTVSGLPTYLVPPRGFLYVPTGLTAEYAFGGTAYTIAGTTPVIQVEYTGKAVNLISISPTGLVDQAVNTTGSVFSTTSPLVALTNAVNLGLEVKLGGTTPVLTLGNGTLTLHLLYNVYAMI